MHLDYPAAIVTYLRFLRGSDPGLRWNGVSIDRLPAFDNMLPPIFE